MPVTGNELAKAINGNKIIVASNDEIKEVLRLVMIKIGLRAANWPTDEEKFVLIEHVIKNYAGHTTDEIKLAFEMAIAGKLEVEVNCYENFSCLYFSNIMNAYRLWAKDEYKEIKPKQLPTIVDNTPIPDEEFIQTARNLYKMTKNFGLISTKVYDLLVKSGNINLTTEQKEHYKAMARKDFFVFKDERDKKDKLNLTHEQQERFIIQNAKKISTAFWFNENK